LYIGILRIGTKSYRTRYSDYLNRAGLSPLFSVLPKNKAEAIGVEATAWQLDGDGEWSRLQKLQALAALRSYRTDFTLLPHVLGTDRYRRNGEALPATPSGDLTGARLSVMRAKPVSPLERAGYQTVNAQRTPFSNRVTRTVEDVMNMNSQGREAVTAPRANGGIDVSKDWLDVAFGSRGRVGPNFLALYLK
jgi:hypothetical protein